MKSVIAVLLIVSYSGVLSQQEFASDCPEPDGFFADAVQCDKYYSCTDGVLVEKLCPNGMVFSDFDPRIEKCDFPFHTTCEGRPELQPAVATLNCPRPHGYFAHEDPSICNEFFFCSDGIGNKIICPETLAYSLKTGTCVWPDEAERVGCKSQDLLNFNCPSVGFDKAVAHPRYPDPSDCQFFYVCINGVTPRHNGCKFGQVFNKETDSCDQPLNVPDCADYYKEYFENYFSTLGANTKALTPDIIAAAVASGFTLPEKAQRVKINTGPKPTRRRTVVDATGDSTAQNAGIRTVNRDSQKVPARKRPLRTGGERRPLRRRPTGAVSRITKPTTTTTTTEAPVEEAPAEYLYDDYYYDEAPAEAAPAAA